MKGWTIISFSVAFGAATMFSACLVRGEDPNPNHCFWANGDATCEAHHGGALPFCVGNSSCAGVNENYGCVAAMPDTDCYSPCGGGALFDADATCLGGSEETDTADTGSETMDTTETGPQVCMGPEDCPDEALPFCNSSTGECVSCAGMEDPDGACAVADPELPLCLGDLCVQCTADDATACGGTTPVCDADSNTCVGCRWHEQCEESACNVEAGNCMDVNAVVHVDADGNWMGGGEVFLDVGAALDVHADEPELVVFVHQSADLYLESILIDATHPLVALRAAAGESPLIQNTPAQVTAAVTDGSSLYLHGLRLVHSVQGGISVDGGKLWASATQFTAVNSGTAVVSNDGYVDLQNCFLTSNAANTNALHVDGSTFNITYTTIVAGLTLMNNTGRALSCSGGSGGTLRNSLLITQSDAIEFECPGLAPVSSAFETMIPGNTAIGMLVDFSWFDDLPNGDLHLTDLAPMALSAAATWQPGDPPTDIDGEARPTESGPDYAGADRP